MALLAISLETLSAQQISSPIIAHARPLSLAEAERIALSRHPRVASAASMRDAARAVADETRSAYYPTVSGNVTAVGAEHDSVVEAGALATSSLYSRGAAGVNVSELITDFGRTTNLTRGAELRTAARDRNADQVRLEVALEVRQAFAQALAARSVLDVARGTLEYRRTSLRQLEALAASSLRSTLDVSFEQVSVSDAELLLFRAENNAHASQIRLAAAMGMEPGAGFDLIDEPVPPPPPTDVSPLLARALRQRPDLAALRLDRDAATRLADAERRLSYPTVSFLGAAGGAPLHDDRIRGTYGAAGVNVTIPIFNGGLFAARRSEAESRATAFSRDTDALILRVVRDVHIAWLNANDAYRRLDVTNQMVTQTDKSVRLAQARYDIGLSAVIELSQAQLAQTSAQITAAQAKYEYLSRVAELDFSTGSLPQTPNP